MNYIVRVGVQAGTTERQSMAKAVTNTPGTRARAGNGAERTKASGAARNGDQAGGGAHQMISVERTKLLRCRTMLSNLIEASTEGGAAAESQRTAASSGAKRGRAAQSTA